MKIAIDYARRLTSTSLPLHNCARKLGIFLPQTTNGVIASPSLILTSKGGQFRISCRALTNTTSSSNSKRGAFFKKLKESKEVRKDTQGNTNVTKEMGTKALKKEMDVLALSKLHEFSNENEFNEVLETTFSTLHEVINDLKEMNPGMMIEKSNDGIKIKVNDTLFSVSGGDYKLMFMSPESGVRLYVLSSGARKWVGEQDGHDFEGLFTRDFMRHAYGIPDFKR